MKMNMFFMTTILGLNLLGATAFARDFDSIDCDVGLRGTLHLDLRDQSAVLDVYCHAMGCSGRGKILQHEGDLYGDTFLLEMDMGFSRPEYMKIKVKPDGTGTISDHPKALRLVNCVKRTNL